jgi:hypothetical protein
MTHWAEKDYREWLYGLKEKDAHIDSCPQCQGELERLAMERRRVLESPEISEEFLAAQRRSIYNRLGERSRNWAPLRWVVSIAMLLVVVVGLTLERSRKSTATLSADDQLFRDLAKIEQSDEPQAIQPLHNLFEE